MTQFSSILPAPVKNCLLRYFSTKSHLTLGKILSGPL